MWNGRNSHESSNIIFRQAISQTPIYGTICDLPLEMARLKRYTTLFSIGRKRWNGVTGDGEKWLRIVIIVQLAIGYDRLYCYTYTYIYLQVCSGVQHLGNIENWLWKCMMMRWNWKRWRVTQHREMIISDIRRKGGEKRGPEDSDW